MLQIGKYNQLLLEGNANGNCDGYCVKVNITGKPKNDIFLTADLILFPVLEKYLF